VGGVDGTATGKTYQADGLFGGTIVVEIAIAAGELRGGDTGADHQRQQQQ
jgi:hypothetical protein